MSPNIGVGGSVWQDPSARPFFVESGRTSSANPVIDLDCLKLPQAADLVGRHTLVGDPCVYSIFSDSKVKGNVVSGYPWLGHIGPP